MVDILAGRLLEVPEALDAAPVELARLADPLGAVAPLDDGGWVAATGDGIAVLRLGAAPVWLGRPEAGAATPTRMNDGVADPHGRFWAGSMAYDESPGAGSLYRVDADGSVHRVLGGFTVPNGPAFTPDGRTMYLADSPLGLIRRYALDPASGALGEPEVFAKVDTGNPDGMVVDGEGYLWSAVWGGGELRRYAPDGALERVVQVPVRQPTCVCFHRGSLVVTSARIGLPDPAPLDGAVLYTPVPFPPPVPAAVARISA